MTPSIVTFSIWRIYFTRAAGYTFTVVIGIVMPSVVMLSVEKLKIVYLNVIMPSGIMLSIVNLVALC